MDEAQAKAEQTLSGAVSAERDRIKFSDLAEAQRNGLKEFHDAIETAKAAQAEEQKVFDGFKRTQDALKTIGGLSLQSKTDES